LRDYKFGNLGVKSVTNRVNRMTKFLGTLGIFFAEQLRNQLANCKRKHGGTNERRLRLRHGG
jgi:hypothetical protein